MAHLLGGQADESFWPANVPRRGRTYACVGEEFLKPQGAIFVLLICALAACSSPGSSSLPNQRPDLRTTATTTASSGITFGGYTGSQTAYVPHVSGDKFEYSEDVAVGFPVQAQGNFVYTIKGSDGSTPPSSVYFLNYGKQASITVRKVPGVVYTITTTKPMAYTVKFTTAATATVPAPLHSTLGQPYRYGALEHPYAFSIGDIFCTGPGGYGGVCTLRPDSQQQVQLLCSAHVRFVRIDYTAAQIMDNGKTLLAQPDFTKEDAIAGALSKCGITELPIVEQYAAGEPLSAYSSSPMQFASSTAAGNTKHIPGYADFARIVVQHLKAKYPKITRVELFNEPNNQGWGDFPVNGNYATTDRSGKEASVYMKAAYAAVKAADSGMTVVGPALADGGTTTDPRKFLPVMIQNGCRPHTCYDVLSVHNYDWENPTVTKRSTYMNRWSIYKDLQQILAQNGYPGVHVMLTEWGYSTVMAYDGFDPHVQAQYVALGFNLMLADPTVDGIVYVNMYNSATDFWGNTALTNDNYSLKPAYSVMSRFATF